MDKLKKALAKGSQRAGFVVVALLVLIGALAVPVGLADIGGTLTRRANEGDTHVLFGTDDSSTVSGYFEAQIVALNDVEQTMTVRVTGVQDCTADCGYKQRIVFYSLASDTEPDPYPEFAAVTVTPNVATTETLKLPYRSDIYRYPYDSNHLVLAVAVERVGADNKVTRLPADQVRREFVVLLQNLAPRMTMTAPEAKNAQSLRSARAAADFAYVGGVTLERPLYLRLSITFVLLFMTALVAYIVLLRPWDTTVAGLAGLVLGTWGLRGLILNSIPGDYTFVDTYLIGLVSFALFVPVARGLSVMHLAGEMRVPGFAVKKADDTRKCPECESDIPKTAHRCRFCTAYVTPEVAAPPADAAVPPPAAVAPMYPPPAAPPSVSPGAPPAPPRFSR